MLAGTTSLSTSLHGWVSSQVIVTVDPSPGSNDETPLPSRKSRSAELFGGSVATCTKPSEPTDSGLACGVQLRPWVGLKSALLSMVGAAQADAGLDAEDRAARRSDVDVGDLPVDHVGEAGGRHRDRDVARRRLGRRRGQQRGEGGRDEREHDEEASRAGTDGCRQGRAPSGGRAGRRTAVSFPGGHGSQLARTWLAGQPEVNSSGLQPDISQKAQRTVTGADADQPKVRSNDWNPNPFGICSRTTRVQGWPDPHVIDSRRAVLHLVGAGARCPPGTAGRAS